MAPAKVPDAEKVSVLKQKLRRLRGDELKPISKMKKDEVKSEIEKREGAKRSTALAGLRQVEEATRNRNVASKRDASEVKHLMNDMVSMVEIKDMMEPKKKPAKKKSSMMIFE
jgi:hypothetical protein